MRLRGARDPSSWIYNSGHMHKWVEFCLLGSGVSCRPGNALGFKARVRHRTKSKRKMTILQIMNGDCGYGTANRQFSPHDLKQWISSDRVTKQHARDDLLCPQGRNADFVQPEIQVFHVALVIFDVDRPMSVRHVCFLTFGKSADQRQPNGRSWEENMGLIMRQVKLGASETIGPPVTHGLE